MVVRAALSVVPPPLVRFGAAADEALAVLDALITAPAIDPAVLAHLQAALGWRATMAGGRQAMRLQEAEIDLAEASDTPPKRQRTSPPPTSQARA